MCNWALRFRTEFRPFYFPDVPVTSLREFGHTAPGQIVLSVTTW